jgi:hypothetical protein
MPDPYWLRNRQLPSRYEGHSCWKPGMRNTIPTFCFHQFRHICYVLCLTADSVPQLIRAGEGAFISNHSANLDEEVFPDPARFDMHRQGTVEKNIAFGYGPRRCVVEWLAREQLEIVFCRCLLIFWIFHSQHQTGKYSYPENK